MASAAGFSEAAAGSVAIVATEAATNIVKHARQGSVIVQRVAGPNLCKAIEIFAVDHGPGMDPIEACMRDGYSTAGSPGTGLGAMSRLSSGFDIYSHPGFGTAVMARICIRAAADGAPESGRARMAGGVSVPKPGQTECGDAWCHAAGSLLVSDGLGHGPEAARASADAVRMFGEFAANEAPAAVLERMHGALRSSRGAAAAIARFDAASGSIAYAGLGNISGSIVSGASVRHMVSHNGTLGHQARKFQDFNYPVADEALVILSSDGLLSRWDMDRFPGLSRRDASLIAAVICTEFSRGTDDVTVAVMKVGRSPHTETTM